jgi:hypothetical protein
MADKQFYKHKHNVRRVPKFILLHTENCCNEGKNYSIIFAKYQITSKEVFLFCKVFDWVQRTHKLQTTCLVVTAYYAMHGHGTAPNRWSDLTWRYFKSIHHVTVIWVRQWAATASVKWCPDMIATKRHLTCYRAVNPYIRQLTSLTTDRSTKSWLFTGHFIAAHRWNLFLWQSIFRITDQWNTGGWDVKLFVWQLNFQTCLEIFLPFSLASCPIYIFWG